MSTPISKELSEQIEREAETYANTKNANKTVIRLAYTAGATAYAHYKERWEQAKRALEQIIQVPENLNDGYEDRANRIEFIATKALASWKEEGKETVTDVVEYPEADILANTAFIKWRDKHLCWHPDKKLYEAWRGNDCYTLQEAYRHFLSLTTEHTKTS